MHSPVRTTETLTAAAFGQSFQCFVSAESDRGRSGEVGFIVGEISSRESSRTGICEFDGCGSSQTE